MLDRIPQAKQRAVALTLLLFGFIALARLIPLQYFGYDIPYWDQWDGEGRSLLRYFQEGNLDWRTLVLLPHNEHRVFLSRLTTLALFVANNRQWDNLVSITFNALFYAAALALFLRRLILELPWREYLPLVALTTLIAALPFCSDNVLTGFQSQFYYMIVLAVVGVWIASAGRLTYGRIAGLTLISFSCFFSMASGAFGPLVFAVAAILRGWHKRGERRRLVSVSAFFVAISIIGILCVPKIAGHQPLHAQNIGEFIHATTVALVWPFPGNWWWMLVVWLPYAWACLLVLRQRLADPVGIAAFSLGVWVILQAVAMSYARGHDTDEVSLRYTDILVFGLLINSYFAIRYYWEASQRSRLAVLALSGLMTLYTGAMFFRTREGLEYMASHAAFSRIQIDNVRHFLQTGDKAELQNKPLFHLPYPDPNILQTILESPAIRDILPPSVRTPLSLQGNAAFVANGYFPFMPAHSEGPVLGSYAPGSGDHNIGQLLVPVKTRFPYLKFDIAGYPAKPGMKLSLVSTTPKHEESIQPPRDPAESWYSLTMAVPAAEFSLEADDSNPNSWFAFSEPVETGRLSFWVPRLLSNLTPLFVAYALIAAFFGFYRWFIFRKDEPADARSIPATIADANSGLAVSQARGNHRVLRQRNPPPDQA